MGLYSNDNNNNNSGESRGKGGEEVVDTLAKKKRRTEYVEKNPSLNAKMKTEKATRNFSEIINLVSFDFDGNDNDIDGPVEKGKVVPTRKKKSGMLK